MKFLFLFIGLLVSIGVGAEIWEKPKYTPDEGHLQEEIERQEENPEQKDKDRQHQEVKQPASNENFQMIDDEMTEDEETSL